MPDWLPHIQILNGNLPARRINQRSGRKTFIYDDKVECIQLAGLVVNALNPGDNDLLRGVAAPESGGIDADLQFRAELADLVGILLKKLLDMSKDQHASIPFFHGILCDLSEDQTFASPRGQHNAWVVVFCAEMLVNSLNRLGLIRSRNDHFSPPDSVCPP